MSVKEKIIDADRQKMIPTSEKPVSMKSWKYLMEMMVRRRSLILETLAFSKGEIFMLMVLAVSYSKYLYILMRRLRQWRRED